MRRLLPLLLGPLLAAALLPGAAHAAPTPGITIATPLSALGPLSADLSQARSLGTGLVRLEASWSRLEPVAAGRRDPAALAELDAVVAAARGRNLKIALLVQSTPCWTSTAPASLRDGCRPGVSSYPPSDYAAFGRLSAFLADRYRGALAALELWNEPDQANERYWAGPDKVKRYVALAKAAYPLIKAADPALPVLAGSFVGVDGRWLQALYDQGIKGSYDGLSVHFYDLPLAGLRQTRAVQRRNGDRKPLWLLETGWNSCAPKRLGTEGQPCVTDAVQARNLVDLLTQTRRTSWLKAVAIYKLHDDSADRFGVLTAGSRRKPSFTAVQRYLRRPTATVRRTSLALTRTSRGVRATGSGPEGDLYDLQVRQRGVLRFRASFRLSAANRFSILIPAQLGTRGLQVRVVNRWAGGRGTVRSV